MIHLIERPPDAFQGHVELFVGGIEVVEDRLERGIGIHAVANVDEEAVRNVEEDRYLAEVIPEL